MSLVFKYFVLAFSALLPVINPLGSALIFLGVVGSAPTEVFRNLARKVAIDTVLFSTHHRAGGRGDIGIFWDFSASSATGRRICACRDGLGTTKRQ